MIARFNPHVQITLERVGKERIFSEFTIGVNNYQLVFFLTAGDKSNFGVVWETPKTLNCGEHFITWKDGIQ